MQPLDAVRIVQWEILSSPRLRYYINPPVPFPISRLSLLHVELWICQVRSLHVNLCSVLYVEIHVKTEGENHVMPRFA